MMKKVITAFLFFISVCGFAQETLNTMFYNIFRFPSSNPANRELILRDILDEYQPDLFMVCELENESGADLILNTSLQNLSGFQRAAFHANTSSSTDFIQNMVFFNTHKLEFLGQEIHQTNYRDIDQYSFRLNTEEAESEPVYLEVFVTHLKSSTGTANQQARLAMVEVFTQALEDLNPNSYVLFAGDFNFYTSSEPGYQKILSPDNAIVMVDPVDTPGSWNNSTNFQQVHTQSTRVSNSGFGTGANAGASGGMDDRFDFIMMSENFQTSTDFYYVENTYKAYGNNGNCLDKDINDTNCQGEFSFELRDDLYWMSDHTPVVMQFETTQTFLSTPIYEQKPLMWFNSSNYGSDFIELGINQQLGIEAKNLYIYNLLGQQVRSVLIGEQENIRLNISDLSSGIYLIKTDSHTEVLKFIKP
ncbi:MAG: T9SS type A sorting domain-containing protein [Flavobacteriaceae bacterium]